MRAADISCCQCVAHGACLGELCLANLLCAECYITWCRTGVWMKDQLGNSMVISGDGTEKYYSNIVLVLQNCIPSTAAIVET